MSDLIDRQAAIDAISEHLDGVLGQTKYDEGIAYGYEAAHRHIQEVIAHMPSVQPERKRGKWNWIGFNIECSECGCMPCFDSTEPLYNYCPNCGADMRGENR